MKLKRKIKVNNILPFIIYSFPLWNLVVIILFGDNGSFFCWRIFTMLFILHVNMKGKRQKSLILDILIGFNAIYLLLNGRSVNYWFNNDVYLFWLFLANLFYWDNQKIDKFRKYVIENKKIAIYNAYFTIITSILSVVVGVGFVHSQGTTVFTGFFSLEHMLAYHILISYFLLLTVEENEKNNRHIFLKIILTTFAVATAVRSALLVLMILLVYDFFQIGKKYQILIIIFAVIDLVLLAGSGLLDSLPLFEKTQVAMAKGDATNGRSILSSIGYNYYWNNTNIIQKFFGIGIDNIRQNVYWGNLHAHNDLINILLGYGCFYLGVVIIELIEFCKTEKGMIVFLVIAVLAYFNGFYMYAEIVVALPIIKMAFDTIGISSIRKKYLSLQMNYICKKNRR